jgi:hypothetical protein
MLFNAFSSLPSFLSPSLSPPDVVMLHRLVSIDILLPAAGKAAFLVEPRASHERW